MAESAAKPSVEAAFAALVAGDLPGAIAIYRDLLRAAPRDRALHNALGQLLLLAGDFVSGWEECEWRNQRTMPMPRWLGTPLDGTRILVHGEQGYGDNFQFVRYAALVAARGGTVVVATRKGLRPLLATVPGVTQVIEEGEAVGPIRYHIPMLSLPYIFGTRLESVPDMVPYIVADPARVALWRERLAVRPGLRVGLVWSGNTDAPYNPRRSPGLAALRPLLDVPGVAFFGLQMGGGRAELEGAALPESFVDLGSDIADFSDTAAAMMALDLVISPCTSTAHLAGALARPLWVILGADPDWRWMLGRDTSPWYPTARLFRRPRGGDWRDPVARMRTALEELASRGC
jgi:hypothetical protein